MRNGRQGSGRGFVYLLLLVVVAVVGAASSATVTLGLALDRRAAEQELLTIGAEYENALSSYRASTPAGKEQSPRSFEDLLADPRYPGVRRHLRKMYVDPLTGTDQWGIIRSTGGLIVGIYSLAEGVPIKREGFAARWAGFANANSYALWIFGDKPSPRVASPR